MVIDVTNGIFTFEFEGEFYDILFNERPEFIRIPNTTIVLRVKVWPPIDRDLSDWERLDIADVQDRKLLVVANRVSHKYV